MCRELPKGMVGMEVVDSSRGALRGARHGPVLRFTGIPFARARRFASPEPVERWDGLRDATEPGPICPQNATPLLTALGAPALPLSEDCLNLTVFTPALDAIRRPVMVWIHGGGFVGGQGSAPIYDGARLAARGDVVVVTINYRLGALGFLYLGDLDPELATSGCNGILDQVAALGWVRENIAAFGGDPSNVTIFGSSAGGMSVATLLALPAARGLFHRAVVQSGGGDHVLTREQASLRARRFLELAGASSVDELCAVDVGTLLAAQVKLAEGVAEAPDRSSSDPTGLLAFQPVVDGTLLEASPTELVRRGAGATADLILGTTQDEWSIFRFARPTPMSDAELAARLGALLDDPVAAIATYRARLGTDADPGALHEAMMTDAMFRVPMHRLADASIDAGNATWLYRFAYRTPVLDGALGACHSLETPFVFDNRDGPITLLVGDESPDSLAIAMQDAWLSFARHGDPNHGAIPTWRPQRPDSCPVIRFDEETRITERPERDELALWGS